MAYAMATLLCRSDLGDPVGWLEPLHAAIDAGTPGPTPSWAANTIETLTSLYVFVQRGISRYDPVTQEPTSIGSPGARDEIIDRIAAILRLPAAQLPGSWLIGTCLKRRLHGSCADLEGRGPACISA